MWGVEYPSFKEFREEDIVCKALSFVQLTKCGQRDGINVHRVHPQNFRES